MFKEKQSFFQKLTGSVNIDDEEEEELEIEHEEEGKEISKDKEWLEEESGEGQLTVDVYQTPEDIIVKTMIAGVKPDDLHVSISRDMVTVKGRREGERTIKDGDYFHQELYWGSFARTILLPAEIEPEEAEAIEKHGLLTIKLPKIDKEKTRKLKVKSS